MPALLYAGLEASTGAAFRAIRSEVREHAKVSCMYQFHILLAAFVTLLSVSSPAHAAFALPALPFQVSLLLPLSFGVIVAIDRLRKRISFKRDLVWLVALAMAVGLLAYSGEIRDGKVGFLMILVCIVLVMFALGYLVARLIALAVRRQDS